MAKHKATATDQPSQELGLLVLLRGWADQYLVDVDIGRLLNCIGNRAGDGVRRDGQGFVQFIHHL